jgi:hypothetical protein
LGLIKESFGARIAAALMSTGVKHGVFGPDETDHTSLGFFTRDVKDEDLVFFMMNAWLFFGNDGRVFGFFGCLN